MFYMIIASIKCAIQAAHQGGAANSVMLLSIAVTYGCTLITDLWYPHHMLTSLILFLVYALSSILAFDPWHMVTSFVPYIFLSPAYINILNMLVITYNSYWTNIINILSYAFSNLDDVNLFFCPSNTLININTKHRSPGVRNKIQHRARILVLSSRIVTHRWTLKCSRKRQI